MGLFKTFLAGRTVAAPAATDEFTRLDAVTGVTESSTWTQMKDDVLTDVASQYALVVNTLGIRPAVGQTSYWPVPMSAPASASNAALPTQGVMYLQLFVVAVPCTMTSISVEVTTGGEASAVLRLGVYSDSEAAHTPLSMDLVADFGTVAAATTGVKTASGSQALAPGRYWVGVVPQVCPTTAPQLRGFFDTLYVEGMPGETVTVSHANGALSATGITGALPSSPSTFATLGLAGRRAAAFKIGVAAA